MSLSLDESKIVSAGNRTRAARVAGEHSTTEPPMLVPCTATGKFIHTALFNHVLIILDKIKA